MYVYVGTIDCFGNYTIEPGARAVVFLTKFRSPADLVRELPEGNFNAVSLREEYFYD